jgi:hypothetical protein
MFDDSGTAADVEKPTSSQPMIVMTERPGTGLLLAQEEDSSEDTGRRRRPSRAAAPP